MDISLLRERSFADVMSVSALNNYVKSIFDNDRALKSVSVQGEISNLKIHTSGHLYFSLKDASAQISAVMFKSAAYGLKFRPENGMRVTLHGSVSIYAAGGTYQVYVSSMQRDGIGELYLAYERLKARLEAEGLFDEYHKKPLPAFPRSIGVITSATGAAVRDIINVARRRMPSVKIYLYPALVQGAGAEESLIGALDYLDSSGLADVIIIGRGGGSIEDLWAFNSEKLARRIYSANTPIISAVGHQTDFTICDFVSDMRAPTPSGGAELAVPEYKDLLRRIEDLKYRSAAGLSRTLTLSSERLERVKSSAVLRDPYKILTDSKKRVADATADLNDAYRAYIERRRASLAVLAGRARAMDPLAVISRGFSVVEKDGHTLSSVRGLNSGDEISVRMSDGVIFADVNTVSEYKE